MVYFQVFCFSYLVMHISIKFSYLQSVAFRSRTPTRSVFDNLPNLIVMKLNAARFSDSLDLNLGIFSNEVQKISFQQNVSDTIGARSSLSNLVFTKADGKDLHSEQSRNASTLNSYMRKLISRNESLTVSERSLMTLKILPLVDVMQSYAIAELLWCMGTLNFQISDLHVLKIIHRAVPRLCSLIKSNETDSTSFNTILISQTLVGLARIGASTEHISLVDIQSLLGFCHADVSPIVVSNTFWALGRMKVHWEADLTKDIQISIQNRITQSAELMTDQGCAMLLYGMARMGVSWDSLSADVRQSLSDAVTRTSMLMTTRSAASTVYALGALGACNASLEERMYFALELAVLKSAGRMSANDLAQTLYGLSKLKIRWASLTNRTQQILSEAVFNQAARWAAEGPAAASTVSMILYALGGMECYWKELTAPMRAGLLVGIRALGDKDHLYDGGPRRRAAAAATEDALRRMYGQPPAKREVYAPLRGSMRWQKHTVASRSKDMGGRSRQTIDVNSRQLSPPQSNANRKNIDMNLVDETDYSDSDSSGDSSLDNSMGRSIATALHGLAMMNASAVSIPAEVLISMFKVITDTAVAGLEVCQDGSQGVPSMKSSTGFSALSTAMIILCLGKVNLQWKSLPENLSTSLLKTLAHLQSQFTLRTTVFMVQGLGVMGASWTMLPEYATDALARALATAVQELREDARGEVGSVCLLWEGLGRMAVPFHRLPLDVQQGLLQALAPNWSYLTKQGSAATLASFQRTGVHWEVIPLELRRVMIEYLPKVLTRADGTLQIHNFNMLQNLNIKWSNELDGVKEIRKAVGSALRASSTSRERALEVLSGVGDKGLLLLEDLVPDELQSTHDVICAPLFNERIQNPDTTGGTVADLMLLINSLKQLTDNGAKWSMLR